MKPPLNKDTQLVSIARYQTSHTGQRLRAFDQRKRVELTGLEPVT